jgi:hypothetical protein
MLEAVPVKAPSLKLQLHQLWSDAKDWLQAEWLYMRGALSEGAAHGKIALVLAVAAMACLTAAVIALSQALILGFNLVFENVAVSAVATTLFFALLSALLLVFSVRQSKKAWTLLAPKTEKRHAGPR